MCLEFQGEAFYKCSRFKALEMFKTWLTLIIQWYGSWAEADAQSNAENK